jgi:hypothetical protein
MIYHTRHFKIHEIVCQHVFKKYSEQQLWSYFDERLLITIDFLGDQFGTAYANNWFWGGDKSQRGYRCNLCQLIRESTDAGQTNCSAHARAQAADLIFKNFTATQIRLWIGKNYQLLPFPIRVERNVDWLHIGVDNWGTNKVEYFIKKT